MFDDKIKDNPHYQKVQERHKKDLSFWFPNKEAYIFGAIESGGYGLKIILIDPRDIDLLDKDREHAVLLDNNTVGELRRFLNQNFPY